MREGRRKKGREKGRKATSKILEGDNKINE